jgi:hypothetical protein
MFALFMTKVLCVCINMYREKQFCLFNNIRQSCIFVFESVPFNTTSGYFDCFVGRFLAFTALAVRVTRQEKGYSFVHIKRTK